ncbi:MAG: hypothetical protein M3N46_03675 [Actinomycetota bacterium]|nr:hypothetical protein [Actinomycetota bacterium]
MTTHSRLLTGAATAACILTVSLLSGCSVGNFAGSSSGTPANHSGSGSAAPSAAAASAPPASAPPASHQKQMAEVPTTCPDADAISISVKVSLPSVDPNPMDANKLECTYYNVANPSEELVIVFGPSEGATPAQFGQQITAAAPSAVPVPDVGDGAYFTQVSTSGSTVGAMNFLSGAVFGYVYGDISFATQDHLTALVADQILVP